MPQSCDGTEGEQRWHAGVSLGGFRSALRLGGTRTEIEELSVLASLGYRLLPRLSLEVVAGAVLGGELEPAGQASADVGTGAAFAVGGSWLALLETERRPFIALSLSLSGSVAPTDTRRITAFDARLGVVAGKTFAERVTVYAAARVFGGPVTWRIAGEDVSGGDVHHYTVGAGLRLNLPASLDAFVEAMPLGEQSFSAGLGLRL